MTTAVQSEYRNLPLASLTEAPANPRRTFDEAALHELAASIRTQGLLSPLLVRPKGPHTYEIVAGARRYRAAQLAEQEYVPVRIVELTDAQALETSIVENLQRRDVHPLEEARGYAALLALEEPKYSIEQIAAKCAKAPAFVLARIKLTELTPAVAEAFLKEEIGTGHALILAKLQPGQQEEALAACFREDHANGGKVRRILLPVRQLQEWIERNILLELDSAPFPKDDEELVPEAGACLTCPKRTGFNKRDLLFVVERLASLLDERRLEIVARQRGIKQAKTGDPVGKLFATYLHRADESTLGGLLVEITILLSATRQNSAQVLRDAAQQYKVDVDAITQKVKQEFAAKEKTKAAKKPAAKPQQKTGKKAVA